MTHAEHEVTRFEAQHKVLHLQSDRLSKCGKDQPGLVAQQEVDDAQGKDLATEAQVESAQSNLRAVTKPTRCRQSQTPARSGSLRLCEDHRALRRHGDAAYANRHTVQAGTSSSTQAMPLVRLSEDDQFRLVIPVPESYVRYIQIGDPVR